MQEKTTKTQITGHWRRIDARLRHLIRRADPEHEIRVAVEAIPDARNLITALGCRVFWCSGNVFVVECKLKDVEAIAKLQGISYIEGGRKLSSKEVSHDA